MSVRVLWETASCPVRPVQSAEMPDGQSTDDWALVLGDGLSALVVIEGSASELAAFAQRVANAVAESGHHLVGRSTRSRDRVWQLTVKGLMATAESNSQPAA